MMCCEVQLLLSKYYIGLHAKQCHVEACWRPYDTTATTGTWDRHTGHYVEAITVGFYESRTLNSPSKDGHVAPLGRDPGCCLTQRVQVSTHMSKYLGPKVLMKIALPDQQMSNTRTWTLWVRTGPDVPRGLYGSSGCTGSSQPASCPCERGSLDLLSLGE